MYLSCIKLNADEDFQSNGSTIYSETLTELKAEEKIKKVLFEITEMIKNKNEIGETIKKDDNNIYDENNNDNDNENDVLLKMKRCIHVCCIIF